MPDAERRVCVDSSAALALVLPDPERIRARRQWRLWRRATTELVAPWHFGFEIRSVLRQRVVRGDLTDAAAREAGVRLDALGVRLVHDDRLFNLAWDLAVEWNEPTIYDTAYVALARLHECRFWTLDRRFAAKAGATDARVRLL